MSHVFVKTVDQVAAAVLRDLKMDGKTPTLYLRTGFGEIVGGGIDSPAVAVYLSYSAPHRDPEMPSVWHSPPLDISVAIWQTCHRDNIAEAAKIRDQAVEDLLRCAASYGYRDAGISHLGSYRSPQDPRSWAVTATVLFGPVPL